MEFESIQLLCMIDGRIAACSIELFESGESDEFSIFMRRPVALEATGKNFFEALVDLRKELEKSEMRLYCYGSAINFYPSPFLLSTGEGRRAYRLVLGKQALSADLVDIFQCEDGLEIATVEEQKEWYSDWLSSLRQ